MAIRVKCAHVRIYNSFIVTDDIKKTAGSFNADDCVKFT
jgi:hypothetical protein